MLNGLKTTLLMGVLMGLCLGVGYLLGGPNALIPAFLLGGAMNFVAYFFSDKLALLAMQARPIDPEHNPSDRELANTVRSLADRAGVPMPRVYVSPQPAPNAFATGRNPSHAAVCVTEGLRQMLTRDELEGVLAHELGHVKHRDILISTVAAAIAGAITMLTYMAMFGGGRRDERGGHPVIALLLMLLAPLAAGLIQMAISRSREYSADSFGAEVGGSPRKLAGALQKLSMANQRIPMNVNPAQSHLFIVAPLTGREMANLFATHPPIEKRIARLLEMAGDRRYGD